MADIRIFDIEMLRDGGTTFFSVEKCRWITHVRLETPFHGEPRKLFINYAQMRRGTPEVAMLLADIEEWWNTIPPEMQTRTLEALAHKGPFRSSGPELLTAIDFSRVLIVRDYIQRTYTG